MARERGFVVEVTAFLPAGDTSAEEMRASAALLEHLGTYMHSVGFSAVAVSSKFTSRKVGGADPAANQAIPGRALPAGNGTDLSYQGQQQNPMINIGADASAALDIPPELDRRAKPAGA